MLEIHLLLDNDPSKIIRNKKDGYPDGRPDKELTLLERIKALCRYASDYKKWFEKSEQQLLSLQSDNEKLRADKQKEYAQGIRDATGDENLVTNLSLIRFSSPTPDKKQK